MRRGIMIFNVMEQEWKIWIGQQAYVVQAGMGIELRIKNRYFRAHLLKNDHWNVLLDQEVLFDLNIFEVYKVRVHPLDLLEDFDLPF
ncbi:hypothetical protein GCM10009001_30160 [Virgibacillus siamensis]|uniref:DUF5348 domain-containing protein n=2 Tax=Virgibacillus siamensis TaxID=480071 RepID=A0ABN1GH03_9BACI